MIATRIPGPIKSSPELISKKNARVASTKPMEPNAEVIAMKQNSDSTRARTPVLNPKRDDPTTRRITDEKGRIASAHITPEHADKTQIPNRGWE